MKTRKYRFPLHTSLLDLAELNARPFFADRVFDTITPGTTSEKRFVPIPESARASKGRAASLKSQAGLCTRAVFAHEGEIRATRVRRNVAMPSTARPHNVSRSLQRDFRLQGIIEADRQIINGFMIHAGPGITATPAQPPAIRSLPVRRISGDRLRTALLFWAVSGYSFVRGTQVDLGDGQDVLHRCWSIAGDDGLKPVNDLGHCNCRVDPLAGKARIAPLAGDLHVEEIRRVHYCARTDEKMADWQIRGIVQRAARKPA